MVRVDGSDLMAVCGNGASASGDVLLSVCRCLVGLSLFCSIAAWSTSWARGVRPLPTAVSGVL